jgi:50S ribosomal protein L16 3-hydroxylase
MNTHTPLTLLGGLSATEFMRDYWQRKPLLVRQAFPNLKPLLSRSQLFELAQKENVESRLVLGQDSAAREWQLKRGPFKKRDFPKLSERDWTLLVQGVDGHDERLAMLMRQFRFIPDARLDDLMISWAADGGGVGPHFDSYDVFLIQAHGQRHWRIGQQKDLTLRQDVPLKILAHFKAQQDWVLEPGDMLYLPPRYAHDGIAVGECMTYSVGFRAPQKGELARELLMRLSDEADEALGEAIYQDPGQVAVKNAAAIPEALQDFARSVLQEALRDPKDLARALGEYLTEPKAHVWFDAGQVPRKKKAVQLDKQSRMLYDKHHVFLNGESWRAAGADAKLMRLLADQGHLSSDQLALASDEASILLNDWCEAGWLHCVG